MCWRGHKKEDHVIRWQNQGRYILRSCRRCHMLTVRALRHPEYPLKRRPLFIMNRDFYNQLLKRYRWTDTTVAIMAEISCWTLRDYKRGRDGGKTRHNATRQVAVKISQALRCNFSQLWSES
jgi:hypothetical protein